MKEVYVKRKSYEMYQKLIELIKKDSYTISELALLIREKNRVIESAIRVLKRHDLIEVEINENRSNSMRRKRYRIKQNEKFKLSLHEIKAAETMRSCKNKDKKKSEYMKNAVVECLNKETKKYLEKLNIKQIKKQNLIDVGAHINYKGSCLELITLAKKCGIQVIC